jgi:chromosome segregation ATPase
MSEDRTRDLPDNRSFEERVFARFDSIDAHSATVDARFDAMDVRFDAMEARFDAVDARLAGLDTRVQVLEAKAYDTKPIWERALAEIVEVKESIYDIKRKFEIVTEDLFQVRANQRRVEKRMDTLESRPQ